MLIGVAVASGWEIHHLNVKTAFLHGELNEDVYVLQPEEFKKKGEEHTVSNFLRHYMVYDKLQEPGTQSLTRF